MGSVERLQGLEVIFVSTAKNNEQGKALLQALGVPFEKPKA
jgi:ribosomal protein L5